MDEQQHKRINDQVLKYKTDFTPDTERALARVRARTYAVEAAPVPVARRSLPLRWWAAAATLLLLVTVGYLAFSGSGTTAFLNATTAPLLVDLPDGTKVVLQQGAVLRHAADYNQAERYVSLEGQAYFEVAKDAARTFRLSTSETELRVTGTAFNLRVNADELEVEVSEGTVELHRNGEVLPVHARQCGLARLGQQCVLREGPNLNRHAWRTGRLFFQEDRLPEVLSTISNNYGLQITGAGQCDFAVSGNFSGQHPAAILATIAEMAGGRLQQSGEEQFELIEMKCDQ